MIQAEYQRCVQNLGFGKRLPTALYLFRDETSDFGTDLNSLLARLSTIYGIGPDSNVIKFRTDLARGDDLDERERDKSDQVCYFFS